MELSKEQIEQIEMEAAQYFPEMPNDKFNWWQAERVGYTAAATKYLMQSIEDKERIKELEDGLTKAVGVIKVWHRADEVWDIYFNNAPEMKTIKQLLSDK